MTSFLNRISLANYFTLAASILARLCVAGILHDRRGGVGFAKNMPEAVPTFLIIGTAKGGTTDMYEQLANPSLSSDPNRKEPPILRSPTKELNYIAREPMQPQDLEPGGFKLKEYMTKLGHPCANVTEIPDLRECVRQVSLRAYTLDATPVNLFGPLAPVNLQTASPFSKIIVMLRDPVERAEVLFRHVCIDESEWKAISLDNLTDAFFQFIADHPHLETSLAQIAACQDLSCMAVLWGNLTDLNMWAPKEVKHFSSALYAYSLAMWQVYYIKQGRAIIVDAHAYFRKRAAVLEKVILFLYGRAMTPLERHHAHIASFWRKGHRALSRAGKKWILSPAHRQRLKQFYEEHVGKHLPWVLKHMERQGSIVVGFHDEPWVNVHAGGSDP